MNFTAKILCSLALALTLYTGIAWGTPTQFGIVPPTTFEDGTPLPISFIGGYKIYCGNTYGAYTIVKDIGLIAPSADGTVYYNISNVLNAVGKYYCVCTDYTILETESAYSNPIFFVLNADGTTKQIRSSAPSLRIVQ